MACYVMSIPSSPNPMSKQLAASVDWDRNKVAQYLTGWNLQRFNACTFNPPPCPLPEVEIPHRGCRVGLPRRHLLLTSDGLSSPHLEDAFREMMQLIRAARVASHRSAELRIVSVLDGTFSAYQPYVPDYCSMRQKELVGLGASSIVCVLLDPKARAQASAFGMTNSHWASFGEAMRRIDDSFILRELDRAAGILMEIGDPMPLMAATRRKLALPDPLADAGISVGDIIRGKVFDESNPFAYIGVSSGSMIAGEDLGWLTTRQAYMMKGNFSGLGLVPNCSFYAHATAEDAPQLRKIAKSSHSSMMGIPNCNALVVWGNSSGVSHVNYALCP